MDTPSTIALLVVIIVAIGLLLWWLLITTEGVYLGRKVVVLLYDLYARRYDKIKNYEPGWEAATLGRPIFRALLDVPTPLILDVATGTARLPLTLLGQPALRATIIGLDYSRRMLHTAAEKLAATGDEARVALIYQPAQDLPFDDGTFDAVCCLEAIEFMPDPDAVIRELVRVARPGALILLTNRKGIEARLMPGKTMLIDDFMDHLRDDFALERVSREVWQMDYDQVWAFKAGKLVAAGEEALEAVLRCPGCGQHTLIRTESGLRCLECESYIPIGDDGVIEYAASVRGHHEAPAHP